MKMLDLFSGIGGFSLAAHWAGIETVAFCEQDKYCQQVLKKHWPTVPIHDDVFQLRGEHFESQTIDIVSGGFPCQPFSVAGQRRGTQDDRYLWPEMFRVISEVRPAWVLGENVAGIIGVGIEQVLSDLESIGYDIQVFAIPACAVNAPHRRNRIWIVAHAAHGRIRRGGAQRESGQSARGSETLADTQYIGRNETKGQQKVADVEQCEGRTEKQDGVKQLARSNTRSVISKNVSDAHGQPTGHGDDDVRTIQRTGSEGRESGSTIRSRKCRSIKPRLGKLAYGLPARMDNHFDEEPADIPRTAKGIQNRVARLKALGNSIVPQVAYEIFKAMVEASR
jgi:DNA (cytosine-5)-methyltransferase 1